MESEPSAAREHCVICQALLPPLFRDATLPFKDGEKRNGDPSLGFLWRAIRNPPTVHVRLPCSHAVHAACTASLSECGAGACPVCGGRPAIFNRLSSGEDNSASSTGRRSRRNSKGAKSKAEREMLLDFRESCRVYVQVKERVRRGEMPSWFSVQPAALRLELDEAIKSLIKLARENDGGDENTTTSENSVGDDGVVAGGIGASFTLRALFWKGANDDRSPASDTKNRRLEHTHMQSKLYTRHNDEAMDERSVVAYARLLLGGAVERGEGFGDHWPLHRDLRRAAFLYWLASPVLPRAAYELGRMMDQGLLVDSLPFMLSTSSSSSPSSSKQKYRKAGAKKNESESTLFMSEERCRDLTLNIVVNLFEDATRRGCQQASYMLGHMYETGRVPTTNACCSNMPSDSSTKIKINGGNFDKDQDKPKRVFETKDEEENSLALSDGDEEQRHKFAAQYWSAAVSAGLPEAVLQLANCYANDRFPCSFHRSVGSLPSSNQARLSRAIALFAIAAYKGFAAAQFNLGNMLEFGIGCDAAYPLNAFQWYELAAFQGLPDAQFRCGLFYEDGYGDRGRGGGGVAAVQAIPMSNPPESMTLSSSSGTNRSDESAALKAKTNMATETPKKAQVAFYPHRAVELLTRLANLGGLASSVSIPGAGKWYALAAGQGHAAAMHNLARLLLLLLPPGYCCSNEDASNEYMGWHDGEKPQLHLDKYIQDGVHQNAFWMAEDLLSSAVFRGHPGSECALRNLRKRNLLHTSTNDAFSVPLENEAIQRESFAQLNKVSTGTGSRSLNIATQTKHPTKNKRLEAVMKAAKKSFSSRSYNLGATLAAVGNLEEAIIQKNFDSVKLSGRNDNDDWIPVSPPVHQKNAKKANNGRKKGAGKKKKKGGK